MDALRMFSLSTKKKPFFLQDTALKPTILA